jgi:hypothetical protein
MIRAELRPSETECTDVVLNVDRTKSEQASPGEANVGPGVRSASEKGAPDRDEKAREAILIHFGAQLETDRPLKCEQRPADFCRALRRRTVTEKGEERQLAPFPQFWEKRSFHDHV